MYPYCVEMSAWIFQLSFLMSESRESQGIMDEWRETIASNDKRPANNCLTYEFFSFVKIVMGIMGLVG